MTNLERSPYEPVEYCSAPDKHRTLIDLYGAPVCPYCEIGRLVRVIEEYEAEAIERGDYASL
ncbi:MAG: hypothetical protein GY851_07570 [bacterium]|nr:hypothetical protein [bacterium]